MTRRFVSFAINTLKLAYILAVFALIGLVAALNA